MYAIDSAILQKEKSARCRHLALFEIGNLTSINVSKVQQQAERLRRDLNQMAQEGER